MKRLRPRRRPADLDTFDVLAAVVATMALILIVAAIAGCSWHVAIDTWEGTANSDLDFHLSPAKATPAPNGARAPRPLPTTTPVIPTSTPTR